MQTITFTFDSCGATIAGATAVSFDLETSSDTLPELPRAQRPRARKLRANFAAITDSDLRALCRAAYHFGTNALPHITPYISAEQCARLSRIGAMLRFAGRYYVTRYGKQTACRYRNGQQRKAHTRNDCNARIGQRHIIKR